MRPDASTDDAAADYQSHIYDTADSALLDGAPRRPKSDHVTSPASFLRQMLFFGRHTWHTATRMSRPALLRIVFNFSEGGLELRSTAWLDGLRGLAAFEVFVFHYCDGWFDRTLAWGEGPHAGTNWYYLPFFRTFFNSGDSAVCLFFAISGYALSHKMLIQMRRSQFDRLLSTLSSSIFRRGIRLYTPVFVETLLLMLLTRTFDLPKPAVYEAAPTFSMEVSTWFWSFVWMLLPIPRGDNWGRRLNRYDGGISWTIPLEYYGSLQVYMAFLFLCRIKSIWIRRLLTFIWIIQRIFRDDWASTQFLLGMTFADYQVEREFAEKLGNQDRWQTDKSNVSWLPRRKFVLGALFAFGFYLSGLPGAHWVNEDKATQLVQSRFFYDWITQPWAAMGLYENANPDRYLMCFASLCCLVAIGEMPSLKRITETRLVQYLGKISFGLYLCHIFLRAWLTPWKSFCLILTGMDPEQPSTGSHAQLLVAYIVMMGPAIAINFIAAGLFERLLDKPSVNLGRSFEMWCLSWGQDIAIEATPQSVPLQDVNNSWAHEADLPDRRS
ncbi:hypothetical protein ANO11243_085660 [Dothideomycetidae sp. 11243]|nr:hypothetical protein ANO11243_085660 [fungal sp. No.11243]